MIGRQQQGYSLIAMVMMLLLLGIMMINGLNERLLSQAHLYNAERNYLRGFNQAQSALSWGGSLAWNKPDDHWQCVQESFYQLQACIKLSSLDNMAIIKGLNLQDTEENRVHLFRWVDLPEGWQLASGSLHLASPVRSWLDYCPEQNAQNCE